MQKPPGNRALRFGRHTQPGQCYMITTVTDQRRPIFRSLPVARIVVRALRHYEERGSAITWCYVLMPDHLHWLVELGNDYTLSTMMRSLKTYTSRKINRVLEQPGTRVWQAGFHDHAIRNDQSLRNLARYTIENPLRAGLVDHVGQYSHWDAWWFQPTRAEPMEATLYGLSD